MIKIIANVTNSSTMLTPRIVLRLTREADRFAVTHENVEFGFTAALLLILGFRPDRLGEYWQLKGQTRFSGNPLKNKRLLDS